MDSRVITEYHVLLPTGKSICGVPEELVKAADPTIKNPRPEDWPRNQHFVSVPDFKRATCEACKEKAERIMRLGVKEAESTPAVVSAAVPAMVSAEMPSAGESSTGATAA